MAAYRAFGGAQTAEVDLGGGTLETLGHGLLGSALNGAVVTKGTVRLREVTDAGEPVQGAHQLHFTHGQTIAGMKS